MASFVGQLRPLCGSAPARGTTANSRTRSRDDGVRLFLAQTGQRPPSAELMRGLGGGTVELVEDLRATPIGRVYTVHFAAAVYVLHAFKKKSKRGSKTPQSDIALIKRRLRDAERDYAQRYGSESKS